jgi:hypothetical protein
VLDHQGEAFRYLMVKEGSGDAVAAVKAAARGQASAADGLLARGYQRIGLDPDVGHHPNRVVKFDNSGTG